MTTTTETSGFPGADATLAFLQRCLIGADEPADCDRAMAEGWWKAKRVPGTDHQYECISEPLCEAAARRVAQLAVPRALTRDHQVLFYIDREDVLLAASAPMGIEWIEATFPGGEWTRDEDDRPLYRLSGIRMERSPRD